MSSNPDEQELVIRAKTKDGNAFEKLYRSYVFKVRSRIIKICKVRDDETIWHLINGVFFIAWQKLPTIKDPARFAGWLNRIATNVAYDYLRRSQRDDSPISLETYSEYGEVEDTSCLDPIKEMEQKEQLELVQRAFNLLSPTDQQYFYLYYVEKRQHEEIAKIVGTKEGNVSQYTNRALKRLRQHCHDLQKQQSALGEEK